MDMTLSFFLLTVLAAFLGCLGALLVMGWRR